MINAIDPNKDVDCFNNFNVGKIWTAKNVDDLNSILNSKNLKYIFGQFLQ